MEKGKVKFYNRDKKYGFITGDDGKDYFFHVSGVSGEAELNDEDAVEFILAGSSAVQFGSVMGDHWVETFGEINSGIQKYMERKGYETIGEMIGKAKRQ